MKLNNIVINFTVESVKEKYLLFLCQTKKLGSLTNRKQLHCLKYAELAYMETQVLF